jgi:hypothetical protein
MAEYAISAWPTSRGNDLCRIADRAHFRGGAATDAQRPALDELRAASTKAIEMLQSGCPKDLPSIPTGRLAAIESRLQVMLAAVQTVRPALERFYQSVSSGAWLLQTSAARRPGPFAVASYRSA